MSLVLRARLPFGAVWWGREVWRGHKTESGAPDGAPLGDGSPGGA